MMRLGEVLVARFGRWTAAARVLLLLLVGGLVGGPRRAEAATIGSASSYVAVAPARVLDTRTGLGAPKGLVDPGRSVTLQVTSRGGVPASGVSAVVLNVTVTGAVKPGYVQVYPTGQGVVGAS